MKSNDEEDDGGVPVQNVEKSVQEFLKMSVKQREQIAVLCKC